MAFVNETVENDSTTVSVAVRIRPQSDKEKLAMSHICTIVNHDAPQITLGKDYSFTFDYVFNMNSVQEQVFQLLARPLIDGCLSGYNATILAYGQTGSGKTYTMGTGVYPGVGNFEAGIIPRAVQYLFTQIAQCRSEAARKREPVPEFKVVAQFLELYNEELVDLLDCNRSRKSHLRLHENAQGDIYLTGVSTRLVSSLNDTLKCLRDGSLVRSTASTNMNAQSSRSHAIFTLHIRQQRLVKYDEETSDSKSNGQTITDEVPDSTVVDLVPEFETLTAKFHFVDLAGSERLKRTGATGDRAKEGISINRGLLALGNVISALGDKAKRGCHVPYRDSKLTRLLQDSLGGNSRTIMIACISPSDCDFVETLNTLKYANRARNIKNRVVMNQDKTSKQLATLRAQIAALQQEVDEYRQGKRVATAMGADGVSDLSKELAFWRAENDRLQLRVKALIVTIDTIKAHNARLMADKEATAWATSKLRLLQAAQGDTSSDLDSNEHHDQRSVLNLIVEEVDGFRELVEKYTIENEELRTKLAEAEALAEFGQRPFTLASPCHPSRCPGASSSSNRVALTNGEFPDLDTSMVAAAEAGLSAASLYLDEDVETELFVPKIQRRHRRKHRKAKSENVENNIPDWNRQPINDVTPDELPTEAWPLEVGKNKKQRLTPTKFNALGSFSSVEQSEEVTESGRVRENAASFDEEAPVTNTETDESYNEDDNVATANDTLLPDPAGDETLTHTLRGNSEPGSGNDTYSDASEVRSSSSSASDSATDEDRSVVVKPVTNEEEAKLHKSLAKLSSQIDSKQHLLAELQYKAAQLDHLRKHYERQLADLNNRIRETERERDTVLASMGQLEHIGEERLRRTREEFEKKLSSLQDEVKNLQRSRQEQGRLERERAKKNEELRVLRSELEELRRYKVELTKRLQQETKRTRQLEAVTTKRMLELKRAKSQADSQIRSLEAAHSAKERALRQKQAELDALKRKAQEQQRQLSTGSTRMTQSFMGSTGASVAKTQKSVSGSTMGTSLFAGATTPSRPTVGVHSRMIASAKAKWALITQQLELDVQRSQTSARLELDLQTWLRERECLGRRLQRLQRRRTRLEESTADDPDQDVTTRLEALDEQIRNITAQLESVQEAINECQASIIELDKSGTKSTTSVSSAVSKTSVLPPTNTCTLFSHCTLSESRFLLDQFYKNLVSYKLQASRLQQSESQSRNNLSVWKQEREQELEVLRLAMQHAGLPLDIVDNVLSGASRSDKSTALCPHHGSASVTGCELCSLSGVPSSAPLSSEDSSDEAGQMESCAFNCDKDPIHSISMSQSLYAPLDTSSSRKPLRRNLSETDEPGSDRANTCTDLSSQSVKARVRMLLPQDMLGLSESQTAGSVPASELMPAPGSYFLRRPRTALGTSAIGAPSSDLPRYNTPSLSTGPSPVVRRRFPGPASHMFQTNPVNSATTRHGPPPIHSAPPIQDATTSESQDITLSTATDNKSCLSVANSTDEDVFNRLTSGISSSPHPSRGSIQPLQRNVSLPSGLPLGAPCVLSPSSHPYRIVSSASIVSSAAVSSNNGTDQPLAAFFTNSSAPVTSVTVTQGSASAPLTVSTTVCWPSTNQPPGFRVPMECTHVARGHSNGVLDVDILGDLMITGSKDRTAKVWDLNTMEEVDTLRDHPNNVSKVRICPVTDLIFTVCSYFIKVWDRRDSRKCIRTLLSSGLCQDGELEMKVTRRQNICPPGETSIMDMALGGPHSSLTHSMFLATANSVKLWDLRRYYCVGKLHGGHQAPVMVLAAGQIPAYSSPAKPQLTVVTGSKDHYIKVFNVAPNSSGLLTPTFDLEPPHYDGIESLALHGNILFSGSRDAAIKKWNLGRAGRQEVMLAQAHKDWIQGLAITPDGVNLISGCRGGTLKLWNVEDCMCLGELSNAHEGAINAVRACGDRIFTAGSDKDVRFWQLLDSARC